MLNPFRLEHILLLCITLSTTVHGQKIFVVGVSRPETCAYATRPLIQDLSGIGFPKDWRFAVACTPIAWEQLQRIGDAARTHTAFTNLKGRITILNGAIYLQSLPLHGTIHRTPRTVLEHEYGHLVCNCADEANADIAAGLSGSAHGDSVGRGDGALHQPRPPKPSA